MKYTITRNIVKNGRKRQYSYTVYELPELLAGTNYKKYIKRASWYAEYNNSWRVEQTNKLLRWTDFIPIVNAFVTYFQHRKYDVFCDEMCVGTVDQVREKGTIHKKRSFVIKGEEYFVGIGNTNFIRPGKRYEWPIECGDGREVAKIRNKSRDPILYLDSSEELSIELLVIMIMMKDIHSFSGEDSDPITGPGF